MFSHVDRTNATDRMRNLLPEPLERVRVFISPSAQKERAVDGARIFVTYYYYYSILLLLLHRLCCTVLVRVRMK